jgi:3-oxoacyl-[acyl-carrier protein] reductase
VAIDPSNILLNGRVAVVTGGGSGIGRGIAAGLTAFGAAVAIWDNNAEACASAAAEIGGSITTVTCIEGVRAAPGYASYAAAKAGVINYTKTAALELAQYGIRVNALAPDVTLTEGLKAMAPPGAEARFAHTIPLGRAGHVDEMANAAVFLASDMSSYITGQTIHVDGGSQASGGWYRNPETGEYILGPP